MFALTPEINRPRHGAIAATLTGVEMNVGFIPAADLLIAKDVLQHWSHRSIRHLLPALKRYGYSLITNCVNPRGTTENIDIEDGGHRYLDIRLPPFNVEATEIFSFTNNRPVLLRHLKRVRWLKRVLLVRPNTGSAAV